MKAKILQLVQVEGPISLSRLVFVVKTWPGYEMETETTIRAELDELIKSESVFKTYAHKDIYLEIN